MHVRVQVGFSPLLHPQIHFTPFFDLVCLLYEPDETRVQGTSHRSAHDLKSKLKMGSGPA